MLLLESLEGLVLLNELRALVLVDLLLVLLPLQADILHFFLLLRVEIIDLLELVLK